MDVITITGMLIGLIGVILTIPQFNRIFLGYYDSTKTIVRHEGYFSPRSFLGKFLRQRKNIGILLIILAFPISIMPLIPN